VTDITHSASTLCKTPANDQIPREVFCANERPSKFLLLLELDFPPHSYVVPRPYDMD